jgi:hypothetical protein
MLMVKREEKQINLSLSLRFSSVKWKHPRFRQTRQPIEVEVECKQVRSHGVGDCAQGQYDVEARLLENWHTFSRTYLLLVLSRTLMEE